MVLLEVMIAIFLVTACILPLIAPHVFILKQQKQFQKNVILDHFVNELFADVYVKLYRNEIESPWNNKTVYEVDPEKLKQASLPYKGSYFFGYPEFKKRDDFAVYKIPLTFSFENINASKKEKNPEKKEFNYIVFVARNIPDNTDNKNEDDDDDDAAPSDDQLPEKEPSDEH